MSTWESLIYFLLLCLVLAVLVKLFSYITLGISKSNTCLIGKTVLITGGNSGLGFETASALATRGARIIIADKNDATESINKITESTGNTNLKYKHLDLSSIASVRRFAAEIYEGEDRLDILVNNAGCSAFGNVYTEDGLLLGMQVNYFGAFLLTHLLIDLLKKSAPSRIIFVSSLVAFINNVSVNNINVSPKTFLGLGKQLYLYGNSKLMNIIASNIFAEKLEKYGITSNSLHPGLVRTSIFREFIVQTSFPTLKFLLYGVLLPLYGKSVCEGAQTQIECCLAKELEDVTGNFFVDCRKFLQPSKALDREFCMKLWKKSEDMVRLQESEKL